MPENHPLKTSLREIQPRAHAPYIVLHRVGFSERARTCRACPSAFVACLAAYAHATHVYMYTGHFKCSVIICANEGAMARPIRALNCDRIMIKGRVQPTRSCLFTRTFAADYIPIWARACRIVKWTGKGLQCSRLGRVLLIFREVC